MDEYDFEKLAREIVVSQLSGLAEKAPEAAAAIARKTIVAAINGTIVNQQPHITVIAVCRGLLGGMLVTNQDLKTTVELTLKELGAASHDVPISPEDLMTWAMEGFAEIAVVAGPEAMHTIETAVEETIMGTGAVFRRKCDEARSRGQK